MKNQKKLKIPIIGKIVPDKKIGNKIIIKKQTYVSSKHKN